MVRMVIECIYWPVQLVQCNRGSVAGEGLTYQRIGKIYDHIYDALLKKIGSIADNEWEYGMYYPRKWDSNFDEFMTLEKLFHYPVTHFNFHLTQISR